MLPETVICLTGLSSEQANEAAKILAKYPELKLVHSSSTLPSDCTHLLTNSQMIGKTEKLQSALARGIPILDVHQSLLSKDRPQFCDNLDVGYNTKLPSLEYRRQRCQQGGAFKSWKVGFYLDEKRTKIYERILRDGNVESVCVVESPFEPKSVSDLTHIFSEPEIIANDPQFFQFVTGNQTSVKVCSYIFITECLLRVRIFISLTCFFPKKRFNFFLGFCPEFSSFRFGFQKHVCSAFDAETNPGKKEPKHPGGFWTRSWIAQESRQARWRIGDRIARQAPQIELQHRSNSRPE